MLLGDDLTSRNERGLRISLELNLVLLLIAIGDVPQAAEHARLALDHAQGVGDLGERLAEIAVLLVDAHDPGKADESLNKLVMGAKGVPAQSELYRTYRMATVMALEAAGRPREALQFLREIAELDMAHHASMLSKELPREIMEFALLRLDDVAAARVRAHESSLLTKELRRELAVHDQLDRLVSLAIRAELREEEAFSTGEHVFRVARLAELLARELCCSSEEVSVARVAGLLHDLGKVHVPDQVLLKRHTLADGEIALLRRHADDGAMLIESLKSPALTSVASAVRHSHERWDGRGYPQGLRGEATPLLARVVAICDGFDAMTHWRCFRPPRSFIAALGEIEQCSGSHYDPHLSRLFIHLVRRLHRETDDLDQLLGDGADQSRVVQEQCRLARLLRPKQRIL